MACRKPWPATLSGWPPASCPSARAWSRGIIWLDSTGYEVRRTQRTDPPGTGREVPRIAGRIVQLAPSAGECPTGEDGAAALAAQGYRAPRDSHDPTPPDSM